jgi:hypothetical protein
MDGESPQESTVVPSGDIDADVDVRKLSNIENKVTHYGLQNVQFQVSDLLQPLDTTIRAHVQMYLRGFSECGRI